MNVIAVDDEILLLEDFVEMLKTIDEIDEVKGFTKEHEAIEYVRQKRVDVAMLDVQMPAMGGIVLAKKLSEIQPDINIIFVTVSTEHALNAMQLHASGYLLKMPNREEIIEELQKLRFPVKKKEEKRVCITTFGCFDISVDGEPISFSRQRAKELLAYLVHKRGATVTRKQMAATLFEDREYDRNIQQQLQNIFVSLKKTLEQYNIDNILLQGNNSLAINKKVVDCDLFNYIDNAQPERKNFQGYYMENYSWAEEEIGPLFEYGAVDINNENGQLANVIEKKANSMSS